MISIVSLCTSIAVFYWQRWHGDFDLARILHADLTGGEVAKARDLLGTLVHSPGSFRDDGLPEARTAYFTLLWCFERLYVGRQRPRTLDPRGDGHVGDRTGRLGDLRTAEPADPADRQKPTVAQGISRAPDTRRPGSSPAAKRSRRARCRSFGGDHL
ncbi:hypothetical protein [Streptomyces sp. NPDC093591]|uniref:hypothetical protein n=1 Tax=Streptomyces sp. NPDC093591 TaxID=3366044 RepID=UPI0037F1DDBA